MPDRIICPDSCPARHPHDFDRWCGACRREWEEWAEREAFNRTDERLINLMAERHAVMDAIPAATEREYREHLDAIAPLVELATR